MCAIVALATLIAFARGGESATTSTEPTPRPVAADTTSSPPPSTAAVRTSTETAPRTRSVGASRRQTTVSLRLTAARADSWMEVRSESPQGDVLYVGILPQGDSQTVSASQVWVRFGNAGSVDASLNGRALPLQAPGPQRPHRLKA